MKNNHRDLLIELVKTDFKLRYNNSVLGFIWVFLKPFLLFLILLTVFSKLNRGNAIPHYPIYLLLGIMMFTFFSEGTTYGMMSLLNKSSIILKINFPRELAVFAGTLLSVINYVLNILMFIIISMFFGARYSLNSIPYFLYFFFISLILYGLIVCFSFFASILYIKYRDLSNIWELALQIMLYATPIIYQLSQLKNPLEEKIFGDINPLATVITSARNALIDNQFTSINHLLILLAIVLVVYIIAYRYFKFMVKRIAEYF